MIYAVLYNPGHNRVYFEASLTLAVSEFNIVSQRLSVKCGDVRNRKICGVDYLVFHTGGGLSGSDIKILSELSFAYAFFELEQADGEYRFKPVAKTNEDFIGESIGMILKYKGKTNEIFTKMLMNIAYFSQDKYGKIRLLDPVAGKGTTLYEGLVKGFDVYGVEIGEKITNEACSYLKKFLETAKYKFSLQTVKISGENKSFTACRHTFEIAGSKKDMKEKNTKTAEFIAGNSMYADRFFKKNYFDIIAGDLPYGVQHGNVTNEKQSSLTRNPAELLNACLPAWSRVLRVGGVIVLSWNSNVLRRDKMARIFEDNGLVVKNEGAQFEHKVDQTIKRDIIVAQKCAKTC